jgi:TetR/AcrR family transcriptional regulator, transcriptional repressor for nem operon
MLQSAKGRGEARAMATKSATTVRRPSRSETRDKLIQIGTEILSEKGFDATGLDEVLRRANVPKGSFYHFFACKADFGLAVVDHYALLWDQKLKRLLRNPKVAPLQRVHDYIDEGVRGLRKYSFRRGCLVGNLAQELAGLDDSFRKRIQLVFASWERLLEQCLDEAKLAGELPADADTARLANFFWMAWEGAILQAKLERSVKPVEQFRDVVFTFILAGR